MPFEIPYDNEVENNLIVDTLDYHNNDQIDLNLFLNVYKM